MTRKNSQGYTRRPDDGDYPAEKSGIQQVCVIELPQREAVEDAREIDATASMHLRRVHNSDRGRRDKRRKP